MSTAILCVMVYDVPDDRRRTRLHKLLKQYGSAVQYSAFEARLTPLERKQLLREAGHLLDIREDSFIIYPLAADQERGILQLGKARPQVTAPGFYLV